MTMNKENKIKVLLIVIYLLISIVITITKIPGAGIISFILLIFLIIRIKKNSNKAEIIKEQPIKYTTETNDYDYTKLSQSKLARKYRKDYKNNPEKYEDKLIDSDLLIPDINIDDKSHKFYNKKVVITGVFKYFPYREEMAKLIKSVGGDNNVSISSKTDFVIVGSNPGPKKIELIEKYGIKVINESKFIKLFEEKLNEQG